jgi:hypothetical protein
MPGEIEIVVISVLGSKSLPRLECALNELCLNYSVLLATTPQSPGFILTSDIKLSPIEIATSISHQRARAFALEQGCRWVIILEDDAQILEGFKKIGSLLKKIEEHFGSESKLAVHLYPEQFGLLRSKPGEMFYRVLSLPDCAVGYAMNKKALIASASISLIECEVADWHTEIRKLTWLTPKASMVIHPDVSDLKVRSLTSDPRNNRIRTRSFKQKLLSYPIIKILLLRIMWPFSDRYGHNPISNEKLRTRVFRTYKIAKRNG